MANLMPRDHARSLCWPDEPGPKDYIRSRARAAGSGTTGLVTITCFAIPQSCNLDQRLWKSLALRCRRGHRGNGCLATAGPRPLDRPVGRRSADFVVVKGRWWLLGALVNHS